MLNVAAGASSAGGFRNIQEGDRWKKTVSVILPLSILAHFALQNLSFHPSPGLPCKLGLSQGEPQLHLCSGESQIAHSQQDMAWLQTLGILPPQPAPRRVAPGGSPGVCRCAALEGETGQGPGSVS